MADIASSTVFSNDLVPSGTSDLLQQAFQQVIDDDNHENEFVTLLQSDNCTGAIHLTEEQAAALGLSFAIDTPDEGGKDTAWETCNESECNNQGTSEIQHNTDSQKKVISEHEDFETQLIQQQHGIKVVGSCNVSNWNIQSAEQQNTTSVNVKTDVLQNIHDQLYSQKNGKILSKIENGFFDNNSLQFVTDSIVTSTGSQTLPKLITNPSQFIVKPTPTVLKNVKILPNMSKLNNAIQVENTLNHSPVLLPKTSVINTLPSVIRAIPVSTIQLSINSPVTQSAAILSSGNKIFNGSLNESLNTGTVIDSSSESQVILPQIVMAMQEAVQNENGQRFIAPVVKTTVNSMPVLKTARIINNNVKSNISVATLKPVQIAPRIIGTTSSNVASIPDTVTSNNSNIPFVFHNNPVVKNYESKISTVNYSASSKGTQVSASPVSVLKPIVKIANGNINKSLNISQNTNNNNLHSIPDTLVKPAVTTKQLNATNAVQNGTVKHKTALNVNNQLLTKKKTGFSNSQTIENILSKTTDSTKPLGSSENPIQIVQQGQTYHSLQHLTQTQLKQIVQILQQRNQENPEATEQVVYRVVFPEELDLRIRNQGNLIKNRGAKRGRPKKNFTRNSEWSNRVSVNNEEHDDAKEERKKVVARTRSGRLSRPPRHMVRDYKHLHHLDFMQPDLDDSDGGYSDYNTNSDKLEDEESPKDLLTGLEVPKRKISDHFRCPTCNKIYLGRSRMSRHFETHPGHGSSAQLPPLSPESELKQLTPNDPLKRKGKKRGPWAYVTPEAKSERRQVKLKEAISACENTEIIKIAAKPVLDAQSLYKLLVLKSENNIHTFLNEVKSLFVDIKNNFGTLLSATNDKQKEGNNEIIELGDQDICSILGINPGLYKLNGSIFDQDECEKIQEEPVQKMQKLENSDDGKENIEKQAELEISDFLHKNRKNDCPEVLSALTLMPCNPNSESTVHNKCNIISKLLISNPEIQNQISDSSEFRKVDINTSSEASNFQKFETTKEESFSQTTSCLDVFAKLGTTVDGFVKLESNLGIDAYQDKNSVDFEKLENKVFETKHSSASELQETAQIITSTCGSTNIFGTTDNFDVSKLTTYDHITHLDILNISGVIDKNIMMDEKLVDHLNMVDQANLVDDIVSERLKNIMHDNILDSNMIPNHSNTIMQDEDLDFETLSAEFSRNTKS